MGIPARLLLAAVGLALAGCGVPTGDPEPRSFVLVTIDTLRREHLGCYGYHRDTTPHLDALAERSVVFDRALVSMATTLPSHLSMLTGLYVHQHGVESNRGGVQRPFRPGPGRRSVAAALRDAGYRTAAVVSAPPLNAATGIASGFDEYLQPSPEEGVFGAARANELALAWLDQHGGAGPFFLWVHYWDPHTVNEPAAPYDELFRADAAHRAWLARRGIDPAELTRLFGRDRMVASRYLNESVADGEPFEIDWERLVDLVDRYDGDVRTVDDRIGALLARLEQRGWSESTVVAVTADHGQSFGEDHWLGHALVSDVNSFVPWILHVPGEAPRRVGRLVSLVDLMPTVLPRLGAGGLGPFLDQVEGTDVLDPSFARAFALTAQRPKKQGDVSHVGATALVTADRRFVLAEDGTARLEDPERPGVDLQAVEPDRAAALGRELAGVLARNPSAAGGEGASDAETRALLEQLERLGYAGEGDE